MAEIASNNPADLEHPPNLQHHFDTPQQQFDASKLGMWIFLVTEVLFFSGLFCAYAVYRHNHPEIFTIGSTFLDKTMGAINTVVLILSSFTMATGVYFAQRSNRKGLVVCLVLTLLGACTFMGIKAVEYADKIQKGKVWGAGFSYNPALHHDADAGDHAEPPILPAETDPPPATESFQAPTDQQPEPATASPGVEHSQIEPGSIGPQGLAVAVEGAEADAHPFDYTRKDLQIFMGIYFCLTGLHGIHVLAGMAVITWLIIGAAKGRYHGGYYTPVDLGGLYWHLVDLIWIYLFPLLYLID